MTAVPARSGMHVHLTAAEAYPALERAFLDATSEIRASFLVFDLATRLRSDAARAVGATWFHLLVHTLRRGVAVHFVISDVDPIARPRMHRDATRSVRRFWAAAECAGPGARLTITAARHPAQTGGLLQILLWPYAQRRLRVQAAALNDLPAAQRAASLRDMPDLRRHLHLGADGLGARVRVRLLALPNLYPAVHHQKMAVIDQRLLYIGGLDLDERRYDTPDHDRRGDQTWHDLQITLTGPAVAEAHTHLTEFLGVTGAEKAASAHRHLLTTLSQKRSFNALRFGPVPAVSGLRAAHIDMARQARSLIYLETQYFRDSRFARALARMARASPRLTLILILPAAPDDVAFEGNRGADARFGAFAQARALRILRRGFGARLFVGSPAQSQRAPAPDQRAGPDAGPDGDHDRLLGAPLIYVHAKVSVFDDTAAIVSSANLNGRSFFWDTEAGVRLTDPDDVAHLRQRVMAHWLPEGAPPEAFAPATAAAAWGRIARANARLAPPDRQGFLLPHDFAAAEAFGRDLPLVPEEMV